MDVQFVDRILICSDCHGEFVFTAGEQLFFHDKQFKNDPKRCKLCKAKRAGLGRAANPNATVAALPLSRTETRTKCSACAIETTVPFKPTQGRPVLCRSCFQLKRVPSGVAAVANMDSPTAQVAAASAALDGTFASEAIIAGSSAATMEMIADSAAAVVMESESSVTVPAAEFATLAAESAQA